jgi:hypothetical protein
MKDLNNKELRKWAAVLILFIIFALLLYLASVTPNTFFGY